MATMGAEKLSKAELVYQSVRQEITDGVLEAGTRLVLADFARRYDCSVLPVREAFRRLEADALITYETNVGARVAEIDLEAYIAAMQTVSLLEGAATSLSAPHLSEADIADARRLHLKMVSLLDEFDALEFTKTNEEFHEALYRRCPNQALLKELMSNWDRLRSARRSSFTSMPGRANCSVQEHACILALIEAEMPAHMIDQAVRLHRVRTLNTLLESTGMEPIPS